MQSKVHRPHSLWQNYRSKGIYHITIVVNSALQKAYPMGSGVLGTLRGTHDLNRSINGSSNKQDIPHQGQDLVELTELGKQVEHQWWNLSKDYQQRGQDIRIVAGIVMPDHFHGVIYAAEELPQSIGHVIAAFKARCTQAYHSLCSTKEPFMAPSAQLNLHNMSRAQRASFYEQQREKGLLTETPLFEDNYDDTILVRRGQLQSMIDYVHDNPRRAIIRMTYPEFYQRRLHIWIDGLDQNGQPTKREYAAFGNLFLLRYPWKEQVMCHRWKMNGLRRDYNTLYTDTDEYRRQHEELMSAAENGAVLVTPGISPGEQNIRKEALERGLPLILIQKEPMGPKGNLKKNDSKLARTVNCLFWLLGALSTWQIEYVR